MTGKKTILVADDDEIFRRMIGRQLEKMGFHVVLFEDGRHVAMQASLLKPVACIVDMVMPEKEGMETVLQLAQQANAPKVIGVSATELYLDLAKGMLIDATLLKPVTPDRLAATLAELGIAP